MSLRNRFVLPVLAFFFLAFLAACGGGAHNPVAPPTGAFSDTSFNGTYTFSLLGQDGNGTSAMAGSLTACGCSAGTISGGALDLVDPTGVAANSTINNGTYNVTADGRGKATLTVTPQGGTAFQVTLDFVLSSSSHGMIIEFDGNGTGSGSLDLQPSAPSQSSFAGAYAFSLSGSDLNLLPLSTVGAFTLDSSGSITSGTGVEDFNYNAVPSAQLPLVGSLLVGSSNTAPGSATFTTTFGQFTFDVYAIDNTHLKVIEVDGQAVLVGDVFAQPSASIPQGNYVFTAAGIDTSGFPFAAGGLMSSDGTSLIPSGSEDVNDDGLVDGGSGAPTNFSGSFSATGNGRFLLNLSGFGGGTLFAAYPSDGGLLFLEVDSTLNPGITAGVALTQSATTIATSTGYGMNVSGADLNNNIELDEIAEFQTTSSSFTNGLLDENDGGPESPKNFSGGYSVGSNGAGSATGLSSGLQSMLFYVADASTVVFISTDPNQVGVGSFQTQTAPASAQAGVVQRHLALVRAVSRRAKRNEAPKHHLN